MRRGIVMKRSCLRCYASLIVLCSILPFVSACTGGLTRAYSGPEQPPEKTALLRHQTGFAKPSVYFVCIDGLAISERKFRYGEIQLLPGRHEVEFGFQAGIAGENAKRVTHSTNTVRTVFEAEASHEYEARAVTLEPFWMALFKRRNWIGMIVDSSDGSVVLAETPFNIEVLPALITPKVTSSPCTPQGS